MVTVGGKITDVISTEVNRADKPLGLLALRKQSSERRGEANEAEKS